MKHLICAFLCCFAIYGHAERVTPPPRLKSMDRLDRKAGWSESKAYYLAKFTQDPYWKKRWWLEKSVRILRAGRGLDESDNVDALMRMSESDILEHLMADVRMGDMALDFNQYFLGFRGDSVSTIGGEYAESVIDMPNALESAREVVRGGDYLKLLDYKAPALVGRVRVEILDDAELQLPEEEVFRRRINKIQSRLRTLLDHPRPDASVDSVCTHLEKGQEDVQNLQVGMPLVWSLDVLFSQDWFGRLNNLCYGENKARDLKDLYRAMEDVYQVNARFATAFAPLVDPGYVVRDVSAFTSFDFASIGLPRIEFNSYGLFQRLALPNSSTNMNRKRGAYILKHYFCDDLTPIGTEDPQEHSRDRHGSEASCRACHYKLDPMAGYFRNRGGLFYDASQLPVIVFDDQAQLNREAYVQQWKAPPGSGREWNVGYIRSLNQPSYNDYGSTLEDLHGLLRRAPEVKACLVRRMFEYTVAEDQVIDGSYLKFVTDGFTARAQANSSVAFKWLVKTMLLSQSFSQPDLEADRCYDYAPGYDPSSSPPCRVGFILNQNCVACHRSPSGMGGLSLDTWIALPDGTRGFPHVDRGTQAQLPLSTTLNRIAERLSTPDPSRRMPAGGGYMSSHDRDEVYLWTQELLNQKPQSQVREGVAR